MKNFWIVFVLALALVACTGSQKDKAATEKPEGVDQKADLVTYTFKVDGLQDSIVYDSVWRIIFHVDGVDKLILTKDDSLAVFTFNSAKVSVDQLEEEITKRGGILLD